MDKVNITPYIGMNKFPLLSRVLNNIEEKINSIVDFVNAPPSAPTNPKVYRALLSQNENNAPVAIEMIDNTIHFTWSYSDVGLYSATADQSASYVWCSPPSGVSLRMVNSGDIPIIMSISTENVPFAKLVLGIYDDSFNPIELASQNFPIEILVYD